MKVPPPEETKIVICTWLQFTFLRTPAELAERVQQRWPRMCVVHLPHYKLLPPELPDTDIFVGYILRPEQFRAATRLKWIHSTAAGVAQLMYPELRDSGVVMTNASGVHAPTMGEHVAGMVIALARCFPAAMRYQLRRQWAQQEIWDGQPRPHELAGNVAVLVGFGAVGRAVAQCLRALGMRVWAVTHSGIADPALAERAFTPAELGDALPGADFVVIAAPETPETHHMIAAPQLAMMKPEAFLINVARGSLVDEPALIAALERRAIAGVALDVTSVEPLPPESPLWSLENVLITPHVSGVSDRIWDRQGELLVDNLERWFDGRPLRNRVDLARGY
jgi:phosphoglycerate dehydrogenase-like enzyme